MMTVRRKQPGAVVYSVVFLSFLFGWAGFKIQEALLSITWRQITTFGRGSNDTRWKHETLVKIKSTRVQSDVKKRNKRVLVSSAFLVRRTLKLWGCDTYCTAVKVLKAGAGDLSCMSDDSGLFCCFFQSDSCRVQCLKQRLVQWVTVCSCQPPQDETCAVGPSGEGQSAVDVIEEDEKSINKFRRVLGPNSRPSRC